MTTDPMLEEIYQYREALAEKFNYDVRAIAAEMRRLQQTENREFIAPPPRRVVDFSAAKARLSELLLREKSESLNAEEATELNGYLNLEQLERLAAAPQLRPQPSEPAEVEEEFVQRAA